MTDYREHCKEHEERTICLVGLKRDMQNVREDVQKVWSFLKWGVGIAIIIIGGILTTQTGLINNINDNVQKISVEQARIAGSIDSKHRRDN